MPYTLVRRRDDVLGGKDNLERLVWHLEAQIQPHILDENLSAGWPGDAIRRALIEAVSFGWLEIVPSDGTDRAPPSCAP